VLIADLLADEGCSGPHSVMLQSLNMLVQTKGKERSFGDFQALLNAAGFVDAKWKRTGETLDAVYAEK